ncbi:PilW family protein [Microbulbifer sp. CnH-101-G]|uniref:PilW family protein n=1 Tax=Microbulbifer sp. CnH-101-G TaxID=3243393 RepID=UPI004039D55A
MHKQRGVSLVELMVSITVGLVLMAGVVQLFLSSKVTFTTQQGLSRVQESGRLAIDFLSEDVRMAGYLGCANLSNPEIRKFMTYENLLKEKEVMLYSYDTPIKGVDAGVKDDNYPEDRLETSDALSIRSANGRTVGVAAISDGEKVYVENTGVEEDGCAEGEDKYSGFCAGDIVTLADCRKIFVFQATGFEITSGPDEESDTDSSSDSSASGGEDDSESGADAGGDEMIAIFHSDESGFEPGNEVANWDDEFENGGDIHKFGEDAQVLVTSNTFYYVANGTSGQPSLYREVNGEAQELLEGVENMQLTYGVDTNSDDAPDEFVSASEVVDWDDLIAIKVELLLVSPEDNILQEPQPYTFNDQGPTTPEDRRMRQVFTSTIAIRSRMPQVDL